MTKIRKLSATQRTMDAAMEMLFDARTLLESVDVSTIKGFSSRRTTMPKSLDYQAIKQALNKAGRLVDSGDVEEADKLIRSLCGRGLTRNDLDDNLSTKQLKTLRNHAREHNA